MLRQTPGMIDDPTVKDFVCGYLAWPLNGKESQATQCICIAHLHKLMSDSPDFLWYNFRTSMLYHLASFRWIALTGMIMTGSTRSVPHTLTGDT